MIDVELGDARFVVLHPAVALVIEDELTTVASAHDTALTVAATICFERPDII